MSFFLLCKTWRGLLRIHIFGVRKKRNGSRSITNGEWASHQKVHHSHSQSATLSGCLLLRPSSLVRPPFAYLLAANRYYTNAHPWPPYLLRKSKFSDFTTFLIWNEMLPLFCCLSLRSKVGLLQFSNYLLSATAAGKLVKERGLIKMALLTAVDDADGNIHNLNKSEPLFRKSSKIIPLT